MNIKELLLKEIESSSDVLLAQTLDFLRFLKTKPTTEEISLNLSTEKNDDTSNHETKPEIQEARPIIKGSKAENLLKFAGTWQGDDFEECLQFVCKTRSPAQLDF
ncbi:MAG: hypothetical protein RMX96_07310 [Nostoc sp. ChiSLP02]|nr:hypothetical protein [Nostoc sp. DedSLP05]MDZ8099360.1 hypothetical protein [Nostoc sp. DedSLP01]MDZ8184641.1 hypothetical protein [Nostoc sp. ChiSLP02]